MDVDVGGGLRFEVRVRRMDMLILVRCAVHSAGRVSGRDSHLGCWLAVEMVIDGRLRQGKALLKSALRIWTASVGRSAKRKERARASPLPRPQCFAKNFTLSETSF